MIALNKIRNNLGFTILELFIVLGIIFLLVSLVLSGLIGFKKDQALQKDTELIIELLNQARNQTISSKNQSEYGVHFSQSTATIFKGTSYSAGSSDNQNYPLNSTDTIITISLNGGGTDVVFNRLSGETAQAGTVVLSSPGINQIKTVTIYGTGVIDSQ